MANPVRTCVGCGRRDSQTAMTRFVADRGGRLRAGAREPGRGAYLHATPDCVAEAARRGRFSRALRRNITGMGVGELWEQLQKRSVSSGDEQ